MGCSDCTATMVVNQSTNFLGVIFCITASKLLVKECNNHHITAQGRIEYSRILAGYCFILKGLMFWRQMLRQMLSTADSWCCSLQRTVLIAVKL